MPYSSRPRRAWSGRLRAAEVEGSAEVDSRNSHNVCQGRLGPTAIKKRRLVDKTDVEQISGRRWRGNQPVEGQEQSLSTYQDSTSCSLTR